MGRVAVLTESSSNLPPEIVRQYNIHVLPLRLNWRGESLRDGVDITPKEFYQLLENGNPLPTTSSLTPGELLDAVTLLAEEYEAIVAVLIADSLSSSVEAAEAVQHLAPNAPLHIVDSHTAGMAEGFVALEAARVAAAGASVDQVIARARDIANRVHFYGALETLEYVHHGGRIGKASYFLGSTLQMKPIVAIEPGTGQVVGVARPRTWHKAIERLLQIMDTEVGQRPAHVAVSHGKRAEEAEALAATLRERYNIIELYITFFTPVMAAHAGPVLALSFFTEE